jgi:hypothetical protein
MIKLTQLIAEMPLLTELRPDFVQDKFVSILLQEAGRIAESTGILGRTYEVNLVDCVGEYLLDECEERIVSIKQVCYQACGATRTSCCGERAGVESFKIVNHHWCAIPSCGGAQFRFVPPNKIEISQVSGLSGKLSITATVAPTYDACAIDDLFGTTYRRALYEAVAAEALKFPGDHYNGIEAKRRELLADFELARIATRKMVGYKNTALKVTSRRFV